MVTMTEEWASLWYQCLSMNIDYSDYCTARTSGNLSQCKLYEQQFDKISEIYEDFGTMGAWPTSGINSREWAEWFEPRKHLFLTSSRIIVDAANYVPNDGYVLIEVPVSARVKSTIDVIEHVLTDYYKDHPPSITPKVKYKLKERDGKPAHGIQQVRQACRSVSRTYMYDPVTYEYRTQKKSFTEFIRYELDNMGWTLDRNARIDLIEHGVLSDQRFDSFKAMLNKCHRDFKAFARNTIRASFPDDTPFESTVVDEF